MAEFSDCMKAIFNDIANAAGMGDRLKKLKTKKLEDEFQREQFDKLKNLKRRDVAATELPSASFFCRFDSQDATYLCVQTEDLSEDGMLELHKALEVYNTHPEDLDESTFLFLAHEFQSVYRIKGELLKKDNAVNVLAIAEEQDYQGHDINDVKDWFEDISIFSIPKDSKLRNCVSWYLAAYLSTSCSAFRAKSFPPNLAIQLKQLLELDNVNPENIYYASTSLHLRQCFMEVYRCLESIFYLPWIKKLKCNTEFQQDGLALSNLLKNTIGWRRNERESIEELFALVSSDAIVKDEKIKSVAIFNELNFSTVSANVFGTRIYEIRNKLVHQQDHGDISPLKMSPNCWAKLLDYILCISIDLYSNHRIDCDFTYPSELEDSANNHR